MEDIVLFDGEFLVSTKKEKLDMNIISDFLSNLSYWAKGRNIETIKRSIENSVVFGMYDKNNRQIGFARVISDYSVFAYLLDVFIVEEYQHTGLGQKLIEVVMDHPSLKQVKRVVLNTKDAHTFYQKFGFKKTENSDTYMEFSRIQNK
ncbi:MAG: GNAT family N-acetyltransferase [Acidobacteriota bacterium]